MFKPSPTIDILIPARNEAAALPLLLNEIDRISIRQIILVDNGSNDATAKVAIQLGCILVSEPVPGYGRACLAGMRYLEENPPDILVFLDGDRSDHPKFLPQLLKPILTGKASFVIGSRVKGTAERGSLTSTQVFGNWLATRLIFWFWNYQFSDLGPFRAIAWNTLKKMAMSDQTFGWTVEMQIKAAMLGVSTIEVPVDYRNRIGISKISGTINGVLRAGAKILWTVFIYKFWPPKKRFMTHQTKS